jgi:phosphopantetheinyl transferase
MGVRIIKKVQEKAWIGLWHIEEDIDTLLEGIDLDDQEKKVFDTFGSEQRKKQWLAYRRLIREMTGDTGLKIHYTDEGKPYIPGTNKGISVSHTQNYASVIIAEGSEAGIDIEIPGSRILKIRDKYLHPDENKSIAGDDIEELTTYWCAKEALYKWNGRRFIDFKTELRISRKKNSRPELTGKLITGISEDTFDIFAERMDDLICVYVIKAK